MKRNFLYVLLDVSLFGKMEVECSELGYFLCCLIVFNYFFLSYKGGIFLFD